MRGRGWVGVGVGGRNLLVSTRTEPSKLGSRCPLFDIVVLRTSPTRTLAIDSLHSLYLGPCLRYVSACSWRCILYNPWNVVGPVDLLVSSGCVHISNALKLWATENKGTIQCDMKTITPKMLGDRKHFSVANPNHDGGHMSLKAAEAGMLVRFCVDLLMRNGGPARFGLAIIQAGQSLIRYMVVMKQIKVLPTDVQYTEMLQAAQVHLQSCRLCGIAYVPKHHMFAHMTVRTGVRVLSLSLSISLCFLPPPPCYRPQCISLSLCLSTPYPIYIYIDTHAPLHLSLYTYIYV